LERDLRAAAWRATILPKRTEIAEGDLNHGSRKRPVSLSRVLQGFSAATSVSGAAAFFLCLLRHRPARGLPCQNVLPSRYCRNRCSVGAAPCPSG
jgi:hypothetical protein